MGLKKVTLGVVSVVLLGTVFFLFNESSPYIGTLPSSGNLAAIGSWAMTVDSTQTDANLNHGDSAFSRWTSVTLPAGNVTKLRLYVASVRADGTPGKLALYSSAGSLIASANATFNIADSGTWKEVGIGSVPVTGSTYFVAWAAAANADDLVYRVRTGFGQTSVSDRVAYAAFPAGSLPTPFYTGGGVAAGAYVETTSATSPVDAPVVPVAPAPTPTPSPTDTVAPVVSSPVATGITSTGATINWTTNEPATSQVDFGPTTAYGNSSTLDPSLVTSHVVVLSSLAVNTAYNFRVRSTDAAGNTGTSGNNTFTTAAQGATTVPVPTTPTSPTTGTTGSAPAVVGAYGVLSNQINVAWSTVPSETLSTIYSLYRNGSLVTTRNALDPAYKEPSFYQDSGLSPNTTYTYTVTAREGSGPESAPSTPVAATTKASSYGNIPPERITNWSPNVTAGIPGGIKNRTAIIDITKAPYNADNTGAADITTVLTNAISYAPPESVIFLPAGIYRADRQIYISRGDITVRGAGPLLTTINCTGGCFYLRGVNTFDRSGDPTDRVTSGVYRGSTQITVDNGSLYQVGQMVRLDSGNDMSIPTISPSGFRQLRNQLVMVKAKSGNTLTIDPPLIASFDPANTVARQSISVAPFIGIEDMTIDARGLSQNSIQLDGTYGTWVKNVKMLHGTNYDMFITGALNCEIRHSRLDELNHSVTQPSGGGLLMDSSTGCLIEDNIFYTGGVPVTVFSESDIGNVIGYNFMTSGNINSNHGAHNSFNLWEGNVADSYMSDGYYGGESEGTLYRNWITQKFVDPVTKAVSPRYGIALKRFSRNFTLAGNIVGSSGVASGGYSFGQPNLGNASFNGWSAMSTGNYWLDWAPSTGPRIRGVLTTRTSDTSGTITLSSDAARLYQYYTNLCGCSAYNLGIDWGPGIRYGMSVTSFSGNVLTVSGGYGVSILPAAGTAVGIWPRSEGFQERDLDTITTTIMRGNYLVNKSGGGGIPPMEALASSLADSLYLRGKPAWFGALAWPPFSPLAPNQSYEAIPAGYRYLYGGEAPGVSGVISNAPNTSTLPSVPPPTSGPVADAPIVPATPVPVIDTILPTVTITAPTGTVSLSGQVPIAATATDNDGIGGVQWKVDGVNLGVELTVPPYSGTWDTIGVTNGPHTLSATARDLTGNQRTASIAVSIANATQQVSATTTTTTSGTPVTTSPTSPTVNLNSGGGGGGGAGGASYPTPILTPTPILSSVTVTPTQTKPSSAGTLKPTVTQPAPKVSNSNFSRSLAQGSVGSDVLLLQKFLNTSGYTVATYGAGSPGSEITTFGPATRRALIKFQTASGLTATGMLDSATRLKINALTSTTAPSAAMTAPVSSTTFSRDLSLGSSGPDVLTLQKYLNAAGFSVATSGAGSPGRETTYFGPATQRALIRFQTAHGIVPANGYFGASTRALMTP